VPKARGRRTSAFGLLNRPKPSLKRDVSDLLAEVRHHRCNADKSATGFIPVKRLRNRVIKALSLETACQPAQAMVEYKSTRNGIETVKIKPEIHPVWKVAPQGAFYKARRVCSLVTEVALFGVNPRIAHDLERLAINIWRMSKRHFDGLCRRIRVRMTQSVASDKIRKSPETVKRFEALMTNPFQQWKDGYRCSRHRICSHKRRYAAMRLSTKVEIVTESHKCKKCTAWVSAHNG
jgi:hypothetical protein